MSLVSQKRLSNNFFENNNYFLAVVDDQLRVYGVQGLRVIDASIMPTITSGNIVGKSMTF